MTTYYVVIALSAFLAFLAQRRSAQRHGAQLHTALTPAGDSSGLPDATATPNDSTRVRRPVTLTLLSVTVVLVGVAGLRWQIGTDYPTYAFIYEDDKSLAWRDLSVLGEPGLKLIAMLAGRVHDDPVTMFAIASLITVGLTVLTIYKSTPYFATAIVLYILSAAWQGSFNGVRQYLACAIVFAGHHFILERRWRPYFAVVAVASLFHISALVLVLLYWLPRRRLGLLPTVALITAGILALQLYPFIGEFIDSIRGAGYTNINYFTEGVNPLRVAVAFAPSALYLSLTNKQALSARGYFYANMMFLHGVVFLASSGSAYVARFAIYTVVYIAVAVPTLINMKDMRVRALVTMVVLALYAVFWYVETTTGTPRGNTLVPFRWVFDR